MLTLVACNGGEGESSAFSASGSLTSASASVTAGESTGAIESTGEAGSASTEGASGGDSSDDSTTGADPTATATATTTVTTSSGDPTSPGSTGGPTTDPPPDCGDGVVDAGEACDDGANNGPGAECKANCALNVCGDGDKGPGEACDQGAENGPDGACSDTCTVNPSACGEQAYEATIEYEPIDIIVMIDNSGSMTDEIVGVQSNINNNFAQIIEAGGLDYRVIMVTRHGRASSDQSVCIEAPLSGIPAGGCQNPPSQPVFNPGKFYHYSVEVGSHDGLCLLGRTFDGAQKDVYNLGPQGWEAWLRDGALKVFIMITDDGADCYWNGTLDDNNSANSGNSVAASWEAKMQALSPQHFGATPETRNFLFYAIAGMPYNNPQSQPWTPMDPVFTSKCPTAADPGTAYQALSNRTDVIRFPLCDTTSYDVIFQAIADGVVSGAKIVCEFPVPEPPMNNTLDLDSVKVEYTPGMGGPQIFDQVPSIDQCTPTSFYIQGDTVHLCPEACAAVQADKDAGIEVHFSCEPIEPG